MTGLIPFVRTLPRGSIGPDVLAVKRALVKAGHGNGIALTMFMGAQAVENLKAFQKAEGLPVDGVYGSATHAKLAPFFDAYGISLLEQELVALDPRNVFLRIADLTVAHAALLGYSELIGEAPGERDWFRVAPIDTTGANWTAVVEEHGKLTSDCSGHYYACAWHAGIKIPNPDGATGALLDLDRITAAQAQPGDGAIFIGPSEPAGAHITTLRNKLPSGDWKVVNNGGPNGAGPSYSTLSVQAGWQAQHGAPTLVYVRLPA